MKKITSTGFNTRFHNLLFYSGKGGVHKTGGACHTSSAAIILGAHLQLFEVDKQKLLSTLFGPICTTVHLSGAAEVANKSSAHVAELSPLFEAMTGSNEDLVICDIGAGHEGAVFEAMVTSGCNELLRTCSRATALIIPFDTSDESIESAVLASQQGTVVLPEATQIFCAPHKDFKPNTLKSRKLWTDHIAPHVERNGLMVFPALGSDVYDIFTAAGLPPHRYAELEPAELARQTGQLPFVARSSILQLGALTAYMARETERLLGFRQSEPAAG